MVYMLNKELNELQRTVAQSGSGSSLQQGMPRNLFSNYSQGENNMAYSPKQEQALQNAAPITSSIAEAFAAEFGVSKRSVISKAVTLKIYQKDAPRARSAAKPTKADVVAEISRALSSEDLSGLEGASMKSLVALLMSIG